MEISAVKEKSAVGRAGVAPAGPRLSSLGGIAAQTGRLGHQAEKVMDYKYFQQTRRACGFFVLN
jgi:hypothetical protein